MDIVTLIGGPCDGRREAWDACSHSVFHIPPPMELGGFDSNGPMDRAVTFQTALYRRASLSTAVHVSTT